MTKRVIARRQNNFIQRSIYYKIKNGELMNKTILIIAGVLIIIVGGYFFFRGGYQASTPAPTQAPTIETGQPTETLPTTQSSIAGATEINVSGTEFNFNPASISVKAGERVKITFKNNGRVPHNLVIEGLNMETKTINGGQTDAVEFTAPSSGTYVFFCSIPGHRASGLEGSLKVE